MTNPLMKDAQAYHMASYIARFLSVGEVVVCLVFDLCD